MFWNALRRLVCKMDSAFFASPEDQLMWSAEREASALLQAPFCTRPTTLRVLIVACEFIAVSAEILSTCQHAQSVLGFARIPVSCFLQYRSIALLDPSFKLYSIMHVVLLKLCCCTQTGRLTVCSMFICICLSVAANALSTYITVGGTFRGSPCSTSMLCFHKRAQEPMGLPFAQSRTVGRRMYCEGGDHTVVVFSLSSKTKCRVHISQTWLSGSGSIKCAPGKATRHLACCSCGKGLQVLQKSGNHTERVEYSATSRQKRICCSAAVL